MKRAAVAAAALLVTTAVSAQLATREAKFTWDAKTNVLKGELKYRDALDAKVKKRLANGLPVTVVMRGYIYRVGGSDPIALTAHQCRVAYDIWNEVFKVVVNGVAKPPVATLAGVYRHCTDHGPPTELPIVQRSLLKSKGSDYYLAVKVETNPVSEATLKEIERWVTRPLGVSGGISAGDALFATFVSVFMKKQVTADVVVEFRTDVFPP